jgi:hypothetical protein
MNWIKENKKKVTTLLLALVTLAGAIASMTPSEKDDAVVDRVKPLIERLDAATPDPATNAVDAVGSTE